MSAEAHEEANAPRLRTPHCHLMVIGEHVLPLLKAAMI